MNDSGWNDEEIVIDDDQLGESADNLSKEPEEKRLSNELEFFDSLARTSNASATPEKEDLNSSGPLNNSGQEETQGYDAVGSLFSYFTSGVRTVAESAVTKNVVSNVASVQNISAGAQYLRAATSNFMSGQGNDSKLLDSSRASDDDLAPSEDFTEFDYPPGWQTEHTEMDKQVMQHLIQENRQLKQALNNKAAGQSHSDQAQLSESEKDAIIKQLREEVQLLRYQDSLNKEKQPRKEVFDPNKEFEDIKNLYAMHRVGIEQDDVTKLYSSCYFSRDKLRVQHLKVKLFQSLADRAIQNQELILKTTKRRGKINGIQPSEVQVFIENKQLKQENSGLKGTVEQLTKSLQVSEEKSKAKGEKLQKLAKNMKDISEEVSTLRNQQMMLRTYQQELSHTLTSSYLFEPVLEQVKAYGQGKDQEIEECRKAVFEKNNQINQQFMRQQEMETEFSTNLTQTKEALQKQSEDQLQEIVMTKNKEIGDLFNKHKEVEEKASMLQHSLQDQSELAEALQEENKAMKQQIQQQLMQGIGQLDQEAKMKQLTKMNEEVKANMDELNQQNQELNEQMMDKDAEIVQLQSEIEGKNKELQQIEEEIDHYQAELDEKREELECLKDQNQKLKELSSLDGRSPGIGTDSTADHTKYKQQFEELKAEFDQLKALYDVANMGDAASPGSHFDGQLQQIRSKQVGNAIEPSVLRSFPEIPLLNLGKVENGEIHAAATATGGKGAEAASIQKVPTFGDAWAEDEIEIDLDKEILGDSENEGDKDPKDQELHTKANKLTVQTDSQALENQRKLKSDPSSSLSKSGDEDPDFKHMRTALNADHLTMLINQIDASNQESSRVDNYFKQLKKEKRMEKKKYHKELDTFLLNDEQEQEYQGQIPQPGSCSGRSSKKQQLQISLPLDEKNKLSNIKVQNYEEDDQNRDKHFEIDEFLLYQEPRVKIVVDEEYQDRQGDKGIILSRRSKRQQSISLPSSPQGNAADFSMPASQNDELNEDEGPIHLINVDSARKSFQQADKEVHSDDDGQNKQTIIQNYEGMLNELPPREREIMEGTSPDSVNINSARNKTKQLLLDKLMGDDLDRVPTRSQLDKVKEMKASQLNVQQAIKDMDNDFSSSRFPESVRRGQPSSQFNFQQDHIQELEGLASMSDSLQHQNSGERDADLPKTAEQAKQMGHRPSNSLHQRHAEIINDSDIGFDRMNSAEKPKLPVSPLNTAGAVKSPVFMNRKKLDTFEAPQEPANPGIIGQPATPDNKSSPFPTHLADADLNTAVLNNQRQPTEGPEQILSDLDEDILADDSSSPQKLGQASPAGQDSTGPVQPEIEVIEEADECEEDVDENQKENVPSALASKGEAKGGSSPRSAPGSDKGKSPVVDNGQRHGNRKGIVKPKLQIDIEEAEHGARIEPAVIADMMPGPQYGAGGLKEVDGASQEEKITDDRGGSENVGDTDKTEAVGHVDPNPKTADDGPEIREQNAEFPDSPAKSIPVEARPEGEKSGEQARDQKPKASDLEDEDSERSQGCIAPSDDAPISRIEMNDGDFQNIIQYSEGTSKDQQSHHQQKHTNRHDAKRRSFQIDTTVPQEEQLNQIQTDIRLKEQEEKQGYSASIWRIPGTARDQITNPLTKLSGTHNPNMPINQTISSIQSINSDDKVEVGQKKAKTGLGLAMHGHSQSQQMNMPDSKSSPNFPFLNAQTSPNVNKIQVNNIKKKNNKNISQVIQEFCATDDGQKSFNVNHDLPSESLEDIDDQYKDSEYYSPLKGRSKHDVTSMTSSVANSNFGVSPTKLQQTMNKLIQKKILDENNPTRAANGQDTNQEGVFSEIEAESQLSSIVGLSPKGELNMLINKQANPTMKMMSNTLNMPKLNLDQTTLVDCQAQSDGQVWINNPSTANEVDDGSLGTIDTNKDTEKNQSQSLTGLLKTVNTEIKKNQEVVDKIDEIQKEMREKRESIVDKLKDGSAEAPIDKTDDKNEEMMADEEEDKVSLDLDDLEDLNNEAFGDSGSKQPKPSDPLSIIDFLNQESSPGKSQTYQSQAEKTMNLVGLGILGATLDQLPKDEAKVNAASALVKESTTGWDDEDMIGDDDLMDDIDLPKEDEQITAKQEEQIADKTDDKNAAQIFAEPKDGDGGWDEEEIDI